MGGNPNAGTALQWGRNLSAADSAESRVALRRDSSFNGAATFQLRIEGLVAGVGRPAGQGFNGAATFQLRIDRRVIQESVLNARLQWGRNLSAADSRGVRRG